jgi:hypothetical protein
LAQRPFTIFDAMALVAATAIGLAVTRAVAAELVIDLSRNHPALMPMATLTMRLIEWLSLPACWSLAVLALNLRAPRLPLRRLARRPGFAASGAVLVALVCGLSFLAPVMRGLGLLQAKSNIGDALLLLLAGQIGVGVATAWLAITLAGQWKVRPTWLERAGASLGAYWIILTVAEGFIFVMDML